MLSSRFAGIPISSSTIDGPGVPQLLNRGEQTTRAVTGSGGRLHFGMVAGIKSERWPTSNRNPWPDCVGIRTEVRVYDVGVAVLDQPIDFPQRVMASAPRSEAVAPIPEPRFENRFDPEPDSLLDDAILDRWNAQRPRSSIAFGSQPVRRLPGVQIPPAAPPTARSETLPPPPRTARCSADPPRPRLDWPAPSSRPPPASPARTPCHQTEPLPPLTPLPSADSMRSVQTEASTHDQRVGLSALCSLVGTAGVCCLGPFIPHPPSCPPSLARVYATPSSRGPSLRRAAAVLCGSDSSPARTAAQVSPLPLSRRPNIPPPTTLWARASFSQSPQRARRFS